MGKSTRPGGGVGNVSHSRNSNWSTCGYCGRDCSDWTGQIDERIQIRI